MTVFVSDFAKQRGMTVQGVYKAIKRHNIPTQQGVSNGKSAQFMTDEDAQRLNEMLGPTEASNLILAKNLELQIQTEREALIQEKADKVESLLREKEAEMTITREEMLKRVDTGVAEMHQMVDELRAEYRHKEDLNIKLFKKREAEYQAENERLKKENQELTEKNSRLKERLNQTLERNTLLQNQLVEAQQHPYKNLRAAWNRKREEKKNGKSTENISESSQGDTN